MQLIPLPWLPSTEVTKTAKHYGYRLSGMALTVVLLSACNSEDGFSSDDSYNLTVDGETALIVAQTGQLHAVASHSDSSDIDVTDKITWTSSSPSVVSIDEEGHYKALEVGSAVLEGVYQGEVVEIKEVEVTEGHSVTLDVTDANALNINIEYNNSAMVVDWGDGTSTELDNTPAAIWSEHLYDKPYTGSVTFRALDEIEFTEMDLQGAWSFDTDVIGLIAPELTRLSVTFIDMVYPYIYESPGISGDIDNFPDTLTFLNIDGTENSLSGNALGIPPLVTHLGLYGNGNSLTISMADLSHLPEDLQVFDVRAGETGVISGSLSELSRFASMKTFHVNGDMDSLEGALTDFPEGIEVISIDDNNTKPDISGDLSDMPASVHTYSIFDNQTKITGALSDLKRTEPFVSLSFSNNEGFSNSLEELPQVTSDMNITDAAITGDFADYPYAAPTDKLIFRGAYDVDLAQAASFLSDIPTSFTFETSGVITGDLSSLSHLNLRSIIHIAGSQTQVTGDISDLRGVVCNHKVPTNDSGTLGDENYGCQMILTGPHQVSGDFRTIVNGLPENTKIWLSLKGGEHTISLIGDEPISKVYRLDLLGAGVSEQEVDDILKAFALGERHDGLLDLSGKNAPPSATGLIHKAILEAKGWTVTTTKNQQP